ncbi:MAG: 50S ribosomal protein L11 methyltransferase [Nanohaloarchaea archaeon]|nr:50S ribosomal protein L11 methyltransferase [Candidatus Nanohaloarchaea archaeon]
MEQEKLREKVKELFERQGFELEEKGVSITAKNDEIELTLKPFSSEKYSVEEIMESVDASDNVFIDEEFSEVQEKLENDVSIIHEEKDEDYDLPSYELIGEVAVINELSKVSREDAVEGILHYNPQVKTIILKQEGGLKGEFRVGDYEKLYGEETETIHKEFGLRYKVDPTKVYFSERFGTERKRVCDQIEEEEKFLVMFAGVGPFAVLAGKLGAEKVVGVEKNPIAADYMKQNIELNDLEDTAEGIEGDVNDKVPELGMFDRIVMPLPGSANDFLQLAYDHLKKDGMIHYYRFVENDDLKPIEKEIRNVSDDLSIVNVVECGERSPSEKRVCVELKKK